MTTSTYEFTTADKVKFQIENFEAAATDIEIEVLITHVEGYIIALTKTKWVAGSIPELVEAATTHMAALLLLQHDPSGLSSTSEAAFEADILWALLEKELALLGDERTIAFLKGLQ